MCVVNGMESDAKDKMDDTVRKSGAGAYIGVEFRVTQSNLDLDFILDQSPRPRTGYMLYCLT